MADDWPGNFTATEWLLFAALIAWVITTRGKQAPAWTQAPWAVALFFGAWFAIWILSWRYDQKPLLDLP